MLTPAQLQAGAIPYGCLYNARTAALYLLGRIAGVTDPETIALNSAGFNLPISNETAMLFLLAQMAGVTNLDEIISGSAGYSGLNERAAALYLAEVIASAGAGGGSIGWGPDIQFLDIDSADGLVNLELANWVTAQFGFYIRANPDLETIAAPILVGSTEVGNDCYITNNLLLTTVSLPSLVPTNTVGYHYSGNALNVATVDALLARFVANSGYVSGTVDLSGGTNAAPGVQGALDVITLTGRGVTVTTN